jgi:hypothetical protein
LIQALLDEAVAELQVQAQDIAALAMHLDVALPSQQESAAAEDNEPPAEAEHG